MRVKKRYRFKPKIAKLPVVMAAKKKKIVQHTTQPRLRRLQKAKAWIAAYSGGDIVKGYAKHFKVDLLQAIADLWLCGMIISEEYEAALKTTLAASVKKKQAAKTANTGTRPADAEHDGHFAYIAGYTGNGVPYGLTWEELEATDF